MFDPLLPILQVAANSTDVSTLAQQVTTADTTSTVLGISGIVAGAAAGLKSVFTDKTQKKEQMATDFDQEEYRRLQKVEIDYVLKNPGLTRDKIIQMSAFPDEPAIKTTLAEAYANDYVEYKKYNTKKYYQSKV